MSTETTTPDVEELNKLIRYTMWSVFRVGDITALDRAAAGNELTGGGPTLPSNRAWVTGAGAALEAIGPYVVSPHADPATRG